MEANPVRVIQYFDGSKQSVIPLFQRPYAWQKVRWEALWSDILDQYDLVLGGTDGNHFMGAIVSVPAKSVPVGVNKHLIIDGQQRLTTLALLLCALRPYVDQKDQGKIEDYLINRHYEGADRLKLMPTQGDREHYAALVLDNVLPPKSHLMGQAVAFFTAKILGPDINEDALQPHLLLQTLEQCLQVVMINLGDNDDPYVIFESLNWKGEPLTQADLVRNYVLMRFKYSLQPGGEQEKVYNKLWKPLQDSLNSSLTEFLRHYTMKEGEDIKTGGIYAAIKHRLAKLNESSEVEAEITEMKRHGDFYRTFVSPEEVPSALTRARLQAFIDMDSTTCYPLLLRLFDAAERKMITQEELLDCLEMIESYLVRRFICGVPTNALNKLFLQFAGAFDANNVTAWLNSALTNGTGRTRWPTDNEVEVAILTQPQYGRKATRHILLALEQSFGHKEKVDLHNGLITIEHVLPQTLNDEWRADLGDEAEEIYVRWVHNLGNLTLTGYNGELGNIPFDEKKELLSSSHIDLNLWIVKQAIWNDVVIEDRSRELGKKALTIWPRPESAAKATNA
jgi:uncharacterized protein with ParB-like and HNH nuclease domain